jgi:hypothetical protein
VSAVLVLACAAPTIDRNAAMSSAGTTRRTTRGSLRLMRQALGSGAPSASIRVLSANAEMAPPIRLRSERHCESSMFSDNFFAPSQTTVEALDMSARDTTSATAQMYRRRMQLAANESTTK